MKSRALLVVIALSVSLALGLFGVACGGDKSDSSAGSTPAASTPAAEATKDEANPPKSEPDSSVVETFRRVAVKSCLDEATAEDVPEDMAGEYCNCAIDELLKNIDEKDIENIGVDALSGDESLPSDIENELMNAVLTCIDKLIGE